MLDHKHLETLEELALSLSNHMETVNQSCTMEERTALAYATVCNAITHAYQHIEQFLQLGNDFIRKDEIASVIKNDSSVILIMRSGKELQCSIYNNDSKELLKWVSKHSEKISYEDFSEKEEEEEEIIPEAELENGAYFL